MTTAAKIIAEMRAMGQAQGAPIAKMRRECLGVPAAALDTLARTYRQSMLLDARGALAQELWDSDVYEGGIFAAKLLTQARIRPDDTRVWDMIARWAKRVDTPALADHVAIAGSKRLQADPSRLDEVEAWLDAPNILTRRAALGMTLPFARLTFPKPVEKAVQERVLGWAAQMVPKRDRLIQIAIAGWLRELSRHDAGRAVQFLSEEGAGLTQAAQQEARRHLAEAP